MKETMTIKEFIEDFECWKREILGIMLMTESSIVNHIKTENTLFNRIEREVVLNELNDIGGIVMDLIVMRVI